MSDIDVEGSLDIMAIASKYIVGCVIMVAVGAVSIVYSVLAYWVYGPSLLPVVFFGAIFIGAAFFVIGAFLAVWGLYWMRNEGDRLRRSLAA